MEPIWEAEPHTLAKHGILKSYLDAWIPIMARQAGKRGDRDRLLIADGFAGPGTYQKGEPGSPVLMIKALLDYPTDLPLPARYLFVEKDAVRHKCLESIIAPLREEGSKSGRIADIKVTCGDCEAEITKGLDWYDGRKQPLGPAFFFLDQFGYSDVSMKLISRIMQHRMCEIFSYLNWGDMARFLTDPTKWNSITTAFGGEEWKGVLALPHDKRAAFMLAAYVDALRSKGGARYVWHFAMCDSVGKLIYWLFFSTNSLRGLEEMKKAMRRVDDTGGYCFSDKDNPEQGHLFSTCTDELIAEELLSRLAGRTETIKRVQEVVLTETPGVYHKPALALLEQSGRIEVVNPPANRRRFTFSNEDMLVRFQP